MHACRTFAVAVVAGVVIVTTPTSAAADPDHPSCLTTTIRHRADLPPGYSVRAVQEGLIYPLWCRGPQ